MEARPAASKVPVVLCTEHRILRGDLHQRFPMRLSDQMNQTEEEFVVLERVHAVELTRLEQGVASGGLWIVPRSEILLLHEAPSSAAQPRPAGSAIDYVPKRPVPIQAYVGPFFLRGQLNLVDSVDLMACLTMTRTPFFALTAVTVSIPARPDLGPVQCPFLLASRSRLVVSGEDVTTGTSEQD